MTVNKKTDFGFEQVAWEEKAQRVRAVFDSVASRYDLMNDVMSLGIHRLWKNAMVNFCPIRENSHVLDLASGSGDIARRIIPRLGAGGAIVVSDVNASMLNRARERLKRHKMECAIRYLTVSAEDIPFEDNYFDLITIAFGLRNVTDKQQALQEMQRCLKPGGLAVVLEFSAVKPGLLARIYDAYSFQVIPQIGRWIAKDKESYLYLAESIRRHPDQKHLKALFDKAGFAFSGYLNLHHGMVAIHYGYGA